MIDKYIIMTIPRSVKRQWYALGANVAAGVPYDRLSFVFGEDAANYGNNMKSVAAAAADDGYPFLRQFAIGLKSTYVNQSAGNVALFWNWAKTLKWIGQSGETCVLLWDDRVLAVNHEQLERIVKDLKKMGTFRILQLRLRANPEHLAAVEQPTYAHYSAGENWEKMYIAIERANEEIDQDRILWKSAQYANKNIETFMTRGLWGFDESMVLTPEGARWLHQEMVRTEDLTDELLEFDKRKLETPNENQITAETLHARYRSRLNNDNWLYCAPHLQNAITKTSGLYSPTRIGYELVTEPLNLGTDVHWSEEYADENIAKIRSLE